MAKTGVITDFINLTFSAVSAAAVITALSVVTLGYTFSFALAVSITELTAFADAAVSTAAVITALAVITLGHAGIDAGAIDAFLPAFALFIPSALHWAGAVGDNAHVGASSETVVIVGVAILATNGRKDVWAFTACFDADGVFTALTLWALVIGFAGNSANTLGIG